MDAGTWLHSSGLGQYKRTFRESAIDRALLQNLTAEDLKELGVIALGHRKRLMEAIGGLDAGEPPVTSRIAETERPQHPERRQLTVMSIDLVGSTALSTRLTPEDMHDLLKVFQSAAAREDARFEGYAAKFVGDGVLCYFGWPSTHENDGDRATRAGMAAVSAVSALTTPAGEPLA